MCSYLKLLLFIIIIVVVLLEIDQRQHCSKEDLLCDAEIIQIVFNSDDLM